MVVPTTYAVENVVVDSQSRNVVNTGVVNFAGGQLRVSGVDVLGGGGGGGGGGGTIDNITLNAPSVLFGTPINFVIASGLATGTLSLANTANATVFSNLSGGSNPPAWNTLTDLKNAMSLGNVDDTTDLNKPVSTATATAISDAVTTGLAGYTGSTSLVTLGTVVTGTWNGSVLTNTYVPTLDAIRIPIADVSLNSRKIISLADPTVATDAATKSYVDGAITSGLAAFTGSSSITTVGTIGTGTWNATAISASKLPALNAITAPTADVSLASHKITSLADPTANTDATNKQYVDSVATTGPPHPAVNLATTANITRSAEQTIDGTLTSGSRVLVKDQTTGTENGIYVTGSGSWTRATDADADAEMKRDCLCS